MALYDNNGNTLADNAKKEPRTDYSRLVHNSKTYDSLDQMATQIAKERSHVAFKSTKLILAQLKVKKTDEQIAESMIAANKQMIIDYVNNKDNSRSLFGL